MNNFEKNKKYEIYGYAAAFLKEQTIQNEIQDSGRKQIDKDKYNKMYKGLKSKLTAKNAEIKKLKTHVEHLENEIIYLKKQCEIAGKELEKHSYGYDYKEKNLVVQAKHLNEKYEDVLEELDDLGTTLMHFNNVSY